MHLTFAHYRNRFCMYRTYYALAKGLVKPEGFSVSVTEVPDPPSHAQEDVLIAGEVQVANLYLADFLRRRLEGAPIVGISTEWKSTLKGNGVFVLKDGPIKRPEDLAGRLIATQHQGPHMVHGFLLKRRYGVAETTLRWGSYPQEELLGRLKNGKADAVVSAGPTGGVAAAALYFLGTVEEISRPVVGGPFLGFTPNTIMMDLGSSVDCQPYQLLDFAIVGMVYAQKMMNIQNPSVALLSIGAEEGKGNELVKESYPLFQKCGLNFIGNVEGYDIPSGRANVIICDGFVGNIVVKFCESLGTTIAQWLEDKVKGKLLEGEIREIADELLRATNAADVKGGGPLWAVNGVACVSHGRSRHEEIAKTIGEAKLAVE
ncbi:MAG: ABC transporter substrate-binding protein, partial [Dehalococcoidia bacterium]